MWSLDAGKALPTSCVGWPKMGAAAVSITPASIVYGGPGVCAITCGTTKPDHCGGSYDSTTGLYGTAKTVAGCGDLPGHESGTPVPGCAFDLACGPR